MWNGQEKTFWVWILLGLIFPGVGSTSATTGCIDSMPCD
jgi:hypothetical protein